MHPENGYLETIENSLGSIVKNKRIKIDSNAEINVSFNESQKLYFPTNSQVNESNKCGQNLFRPTNSHIDQNELAQKILFYNSKLFSYNGVSNTKAEEILKDTQNLIIGMNNDLKRKIDACLIGCDVSVQESSVQDLITFHHGIVCFRVLK